MTRSERGDTKMTDKPDKTKESKNTNMALWDSVCETEKEFVRQISYGTRKFSAIDAMYQIRNATSQWGIYGTTWGLKELVWELIRDEKNVLIELSLNAIFWYPHGEFPIASDIKYDPGRDCRKKLMTDVTTKALSKLGYNADVFLGAFDDNPYENGHGRDKGGKPPRSKDKPTGKPAPKRETRPKKKEEPWLDICKTDKVLGDAFKALKLTRNDGDELWNCTLPEQGMSQADQFRAMIREKADARTNDNPTNEDSIPF